MAYKSVKDLDAVDIKIIEKLCRDSSASLSDIAQELGVSASTVGTMAGQMVMQGFLRRSIPIGIRRSITIGPSLLVIIIRLEPTRTLVISQVILSFVLPR